MNKIQKLNLYNIRRSFEKKTGTRLLPASEVYAEESDRNTQPKSKRHPFKTVAPIILCVIILAGCLFAVLPKLGNTSEPSESTESKPSLSESQVPSGSEENENAEETKPTEGLNIDDYNMQIVRESNGMTVSQTILIPDGRPINIEAVVDTANAERVSTYKYLPKWISDELRVAVFEAYFQERAKEVYRYTYGNATYHWDLKNDSEWYTYGYSRQLSPVDQPNLFLRNCYTSYDASDMLPSLSDVEFSLASAVKECAPVVEVLAEGSTYEPYIIRPYSLLEDDLPSGSYYYIVFRRIVDGMPIVAGLDLQFRVSEEEAFQIIWTMYDIEETPITQTIIGVNDALRLLEENAGELDHNILYSWEQPDGDIAVSKIALEYFVMQGTEGNGIIIPIWRFYIGSDAEQINRFRDRVIAVNALTGEVIMRRRR